MEAVQTISPTMLARVHWRQGGELSDNPYPKGSKERETYNWEMHRLQVQDFEAEQAELRAGV